MVKAEHFVRKVADGQAREAGMVVVERVNAHGPADFAVFVESDAFLNGLLGKRPVAVVMIELVRLRVV